MSQLLQRAIRRQQAIQQSRGMAWVLFIALLPVAFLSALSLLFSAAETGILSLGSVISCVVLISALWVAGYLFKEARRLGKLLKDPGLIMRLEQDPDLVGGVHWSGLIPFSGWRD